MKEKLQRTNGCTQCPKQRLATKNEICKKTTSLNFLDSRTAAAFHRS